MKVNTAKRMAEIRAMRGSDHGKKAAKTNIKKYGKGFYSNIGKLGGSVSHPDTRHFHAHPEVAKQAGSKGGKISTREGILNGQGRKRSLPEAWDQPKPNGKFIKWLRGIK